MIEGFAKQAPTGTTSQIIWVGLVLKSIDNFFGESINSFIPIITKIIIAMFVQNNFGILEIVFSFLSP
ncbi:hypothetical protein HPP_4700 [Hydrangea phyllody phytoplasma]|uniref:Uncharacterized protein n=2 Tax=16SrI (Aster yellows group) TaxID=3042590 RepID=A0ABQ5PTH1_9MOLU|nr:hypothetical protein HPP_4700 [Hydrangea phyllody phytoplasma]GLH61262.1 hypothetical protein RHYP_2070 [Rhus yellows phytoplasma]GLH62037.1 hypothetical protein HP2P_4440 [Hydrangea phyllody phytoplasma]